jgi:hypothetical protein
MTRHLVPAVQEMMEISQRLTERVQTPCVLMFDEQRGGMGSYAWAGTHGWRDGWCGGGSVQSGKRCEKAQPEGKVAAHTVN